MEIHGDDVCLYCESGAGGEPVVCSCGHSDCAADCTLVNCFGITLYARLGSIGGILGTPPPSAVLIICALVWLLRSNPSAPPVAAAKLLPPLKSWTDWMLLTGMMVSLTGIGMTALHIADLKTSARTCPAGLLMSLLIIIAPDAAGALAIALTVPPEELSMASGADEAFADLFRHLHMSRATAPMRLMLCHGPVT